MGIFVNVYVINTKLVYELAHIFAFFQILAGSSEEYSLLQTYHLRRHTLNKKNYVVKMCYFPSGGR